MIDSAFKLDLLEKAHDYFVKTANERDITSQNSLSFAEAQITPMFIKMISNI